MPRPDAVDPTEIEPKKDSPFLAMLKKAGAIKSPAAELKGTTFGVQPKRCGCIGVMHDAECHIAMS